MNQFRKEYNSNLSMQYFCQIVIGSDSKHTLKNQCPTTEVVQQPQEMQNDEQTSQSLPFLSHQEMLLNPSKASFFTCFAQQLQQSTLEASLLHAHNVFNCNS